MKYIEKVNADFCIIFLMLLLYQFAYAEDNKILYFDTTHHLNAVLCIAKDNTVALEDGEMHIARKANKSDCYAEITMPESFSYAEQFVLEFQIKGETIKSGIRLFQANLHSGISLAECTAGFVIAKQKRYSVMDEKDGVHKVQSLLGDSVVFSEKIFYGACKKQKCADAFLAEPYYIENILMIPTDAVSRLGAVAEVSEDGITINGYTLSVGSASER